MVLYLEGSQPGALLPRILDQLKPESSRKQQCMQPGKTEKKRRLISICQAVGRLSGTVLVAFRLQTLSLLASANSWGPNIGRSMRQRLRRLRED